MTYSVLEVKKCKTYGQVAKVSHEFDTKHPAVVLEDALNNIVRTGFSTASNGTWYMTCRTDRINDACANCGVYFSK